MVPIIDRISSIKDNALFVAKASAPAQFGLKLEVNPCSTCLFSSC
jgi:hypothetical protein